MNKVTLVDTFIDEVLVHLNNKESFSFIRYGDGEAMVLGNNSKMQWMLNKQLGYVPNDNDIINIKKNLLLAYQDADMIGIPQEKHTNRDDEWKDSMIIFKEAIGNKIVADKLLTSIDIVYECLNQSMLARMNALFRPSFDELLKDREKLNYISCRNLDNELKNKFNIKEVNSYIIAPEMKFTPDYKGKRHYPDQFNEIYDWIKKVTNQGDLCLVGAGVVGKIYNSWFASVGGISLDFGAVFDLWAGKNTRGPGRGATAIDNTFKI